MARNADIVEELDEFVSRLTQMVNTIIATSIGDMVSHPDKGMSVILDMLDKYVNLAYEIEQWIVGLTTQERTGVDSTDTEYGQLIHLWEARYSATQTDAQAIIDKIDMYLGRITQITKYVVKASECAFTPAFHEAVSNEKKVMGLLLNNAAITLQRLITHSIKGHKSNLDKEFRKYITKDVSLPNSYC